MSKNLKQINNELDTLLENMNLASKDTLLSSSQKLEKPKKNEIQNLREDVFDIKSELTLIRKNIFDELKIISNESALKIQENFYDTTNNSIYEIKETLRQEIFKIRDEFYNELKSIKGEFYDMKLIFQKINLDIENSKEFLKDYKKDQNKNLGFSSQNKINIVNQEIDFPKTKTQKFLDVDKKIQRLDRILNS